MSAGPDVTPGPDVSSGPDVAPDVPDGPTASVVIGIPTYRRPVQLAALLASVRPELDARVALVIVADNASDPATTDVVRAELGEAVPVHVVAVAEPGISAVRNALIRTAYELVPSWSWLIMLDDDGLICPGWLDPLLAAAKGYDADIAAGPVLGELPEGASRLARNSLYGGRPRYPTGVVRHLNGGQNIAIARRLADGMTPPWFAPHLGLSGGEDHAFFRRASQAGARLVWCDEACVLEPTPAERLTARGILTRAHRSNVVSARTDVSHLGRAAVLGSLRAPIRLWARSTASCVLRRDPDRLARNVIEAAALSGRLRGALGARRETPPDQP